MSEGSGVNGDAGRFEPPQDVPPALAGMLLDGRVGMREIAVMLVDLSLRGWFSMEATDAQWSLVTPTVLPPSGAAPGEAEKLLMRTIFRPSPVETPGQDAAPQFVSMTSLRHRMQGHVDEICAALGEQALDAGLVTRNPARRSLRGRSGLLTPAGQAARDHLEGFRAYLSGAAASSGQDGVDAVLPYAIALEVLPQFAESFAGQGSQGSPAASAMLRDLQTNPVLVGVAGSGGFSLEDLTTLQVARNYGAAFQPGRR